MFLVPSAISAWGYATNTPVITNEQSELPETGCHYGCPTPTHTPTHSPTPTPTQTPTRPPTPTPTATPTGSPIPTPEASTAPGQTNTPAPVVQTNELAHTGANTTGLVIGTLIVILAAGFGIYLIVRRTLK